MTLSKQNRSEYIRLYVDYVLNASIQEQFAAFKYGLLLLALFGAVCLHHIVHM